MCMPFVDREDWSRWHYVFPTASRFPVWLVIGLFHFYEATKDAICFLVQVLRWSSSEFPPSCSRSRPAFLERYWHMNKRKLIRVQGPQLGLTKRARKVTELVVLLLACFRLLLLLLLWLWRRWCGCCGCCCCCWAWLLVVGCGFGRCGCRRRAAAALFSLGQKDRLKHTYILVVQAMWKHTQTKSQVIFSRSGVGMRLAGETQHE